MIIRVLVTGAAGFLGKKVVEKLLDRGSLRGADGREHAIAQIVTTDRVDHSWDASSIPVAHVPGDISEPSHTGKLFDRPVDSVFHMAAALALESEAHFEQGMAINLGGTMALLDLCRRQARPATFIFPSSLAVFGGTLPDTVGDHVPQTPQTSYGTHKSIIELLINDYSRHGFIDGRGLRLPIVLLRAGAPSPAISDRVAAVARDPLHGRDIVCPFNRDTVIPVASGDTVARSLLDLHDLDAAGLGGQRFMNLPSLSVTFGDIEAAVGRKAGALSLGHVT
ncbi:MAG: NAD-dependent epimerase/dehydratase family protein [Rhodospirillales bacterium]|nr:NAD-dependent epimerase/dehydratase family protein [Rhodospirillales bacterium]MBO6787170.1 NAD-dependent epimerase/dehydratase family protein [Rhodospirillales bacterium]